MRLFSHLLALTTALAAQADAQEILAARARQLGPRTNRPAQDRAVLEPLPPPDAGAAERAALPRMVALDSTPHVEPAVLDDSIPRPGAPRVRATEQGDVLEDQAGGDPFFLDFIGGDYYPPPNERIDPELAAQVDPFPTDGRPQPVVYAFAMFQRRITEQRLAEIEGLGARVLGIHPYYCVKLAIPPDKVTDVAAHDAVRWLGTPKRWQKLHPLLAAARDAARTAHAQPTIDLVVNVYDSDLNASSVVEALATPSITDARAAVATPQVAGTPMTRTRSNGWQQRSLETLGVEVNEYVDSIRAFRVRTQASRVDELAALDFVQFVEPQFEKGALHDSSIPMIYSDSVRYYANGGVSQSVVAGIIDSGYDWAHAGLNHVNTVGWQMGGTGGAYNDPCEHGTHVAGTLLGSGAGNAMMRGNAPGLGYGGNGRFYVVKTSNACSNWTGSLASWISPFQTPYWDGVNTTPVPHVINNSWGSGVFNNMGQYIGPYWGTEADARTLDGEVFSRGQMYVFAAGNDGSGASTIGLQAAAKNVFAVGSVDDTWSFGADLPGEISSFSSRGPTGDGRWKPNVVAPGDSIQSVDASSGSGYSSKSGTSMAAPHVTGVVSQLLDHFPWLHYVPERTQSLLMASAMTKGNQQLTLPTETHLDNYGAGRVDAWKANYPTSQLYWLNWGHYIAANNTAWADFTISSGCTRLVVCMTYVEAAASAGAGQALINNLDLSIDQPPIDPNLNTGDWVAQQSALDNTEIRILDFPVSGTWRWKIWPTNQPQGVYYGLTIYAVYGDITPDLSVTVTPAKAYLKPFEYTDVTVTAWSPTYLASNVVVDPDYGWGQGWATSVTKTLNDGPVVGLGSGTYKSMLFGDILHGNIRSGVWRTQWAQEGIWGFIANVRGDNVASQSPMGVVTIDGTAPSAVDPVDCLDHAVGTWSSDTLYDFAWTAASDNLAGVYGYSRSSSLDAPATPDDVVDQMSTAMTNTSLPSSASGYYFNVRAVDWCGNAGPVSSIGPFYSDSIAPDAIAGLDSTTHVAGTSSCNGSIVMAWSDAYDEHSGVVGYSYEWDQIADTEPDAAAEIVAAGVGGFLPEDPGVPYYFHVRAIDAAGNAGPTAHFGPVTIEPAATTTFCEAKLHGGGCLATIGAWGCPSLYGSAQFHLVASSVLGQTQGALLWSVHGVSTPPIAGVMGQYGKSPKGNRICLIAPKATGPQFSGGDAGDCSGSFDFHFDQDLMAAHGLAAGMTIYAQILFDDPLSANASQLAHTDALAFTLQP